jgi:hypothetical protein
MAWLAHVQYVKYTPASLYLKRLTMCHAIQEARKHDELRRILSLSLKDTDPFKP